MKAFSTGDIASGWIRAGVGGAIRTNKWYIKMLEQLAVAVVMKVMVKKEWQWCGTTSVQGGKARGQREGREGDGRRD